MPFRCASLLVAGAVLVGPGVAPSGHGQPASAPYALVEGWGQLPAGMEWGEVPAMAIDAAGKVFAFHRIGPPIVELDRAGRILKTWGEGRFVWPHGFRVDRNGFLWATDGRARDGRGQQVFKFSPDGTLLMTLGTAGVSGDGPDTFRGPTDVAVAASGEVFVADGHVNGRIVKFSAQGAFIKAWGRKGNAPGEFDVPHTLVIDSQGRVLVGDRSNRRIQLFDQEGAFIAQWTQFGSPSGMFVAPDDTLYVVDYNDRKALFIGSARDGSVRHTSALTLAEGVAVDQDGSIYVGETVTGHTVRKLVKTAP